MRFDVFKKNFKFIENFNKKGNKTYKLGVNEFADWTEEEFIATHTGLKGINGISFSEFVDEMIPSWNWNVSDVARETKDWRYEGAVTPVRYQGQCGTLIIHYKRLSLHVLFSTYFDSWSIKIVPNYWITRLTS